MTRRFFVSLAFALTLFLSACSQTPEITSPGLEPQFGTAAADRAVDVAVQRRLGHVYVAGNLGNRAFLRQYGRNGTVAWERLSAAKPGLHARTLASGVDARGNAYLAWAYYDADFAFDAVEGPFITKLDQKGALLWRKTFSDLYSMDVDAQGNLYLAGRNSVRKHTPSGALVWERKPSTRDARMTQIAVSPKGNVVAASSNGLIVKYDGSGTRMFRTVRNFGFSGPDDLALGPNEEIAASYTAITSEGTVYRARVKVFTPEGTALWDDGVVVEYPGASLLPAVTVGADGSVYFTTEHFACGASFDFGQDGDGATCLGGEDTDSAKSAILVRKYTPSGAPVWSRVLNKNREGLDGGTGIAAFSSSELYVVGATESAVNGRNFGGVDAFLLRLDARGKSVWSR